MAKRIILFMGVLTLLFIAGCSSNNKSVEALDKENNELKQKNIQLENKNIELATKIDNIRKDSINNQSNSIERDVELNLSKKEARILRSALADSNGKSYILNMFNPFNLEVGDKVGNFTVKNLNMSQDLESVGFEGAFTVTGDLFTNIMGSSAFSMLLNKSEFYKIPYSIRQIDDDRMFIDITNSKDEIIFLLGKSYTEPDAGGEFKITITATLSEYNNRFKYETEVASTAKLIKLVSIDK